MYKLVDLFSGCGGLGLGMEQAGFTVSFASDIDKNAARTYLYNRNYLKHSQQYKETYRRLPYPLHTS